MVELHVNARGAATSIRADISALPAITRVHDALYRRGNVARARRGVRIFDVFPGFFRLAEATRLYPLELLRHRRLDRREQIRTRHERNESLELLVKLGTGCKLNFIARRRERLHNGRLPGSGSGRSLSLNSVRAQLNRPLVLRCSSRPKQGLKRTRRDELHVGRDAVHDAEKAYSASRKLRQDCREPPSHEPRGSPSSGS